jgi:hypothetical protein
MSWLLAQSAFSGTEFTDYKRLARIGMFSWVPRR